MAMGREKLPWGMFSFLGSNIDRMKKAKQCGWLTEIPFHLYFVRLNHRLFSEEGELHLNVFKAGQILASTQARWLTCTAVTHKKQAGRGGN